MEFERLPLRLGAAAGALALILAGAASPSRATELQQSIDQTGTAINRQLGDWLGVAPQQPAARSKRPPAAISARPAEAVSTRIPLPPRRPLEANRQAEGVAKTDATKTDATKTDAAKVETPKADAPAATPEVSAAEALPPPPATAPVAEMKPVATPPVAALTVPPPEAAVVPLPPPAPERLAALPPAEPAAEASPRADAPAPIPTVCPELSNDDIGVFTAVTVTATNAACTVDRGVSLSAVRMKDGRLVALEPAAVLRCEMAAAVAHWVRDDVEPAVATLGAPLDKVLVAAAQQCRSRNRVAGAKISEHGRGNALDTRGYVLKDGARFVIGTPRAGSAEKPMPVAFQEALKASACTDFTTILGPGSDGFHEEHLHIDRAERRSGAVLCRWATGPAVARVPTPMAKPPQAPGDAEAHEAPEDAPEDASAPDTAASGTDSGQ